ncbi:hypothetical protein Dsin_029260 [Dipteronia sinensis]|uniref:Uncharacterized protein n=1 Tax=Dipteronia sinensis TaxID=43782 RepID=A0AAE0DVE1_9ROSI|nr:hypothetical protein Dsin_029260 [Dipteronia sinensis]
MSEAVKGWVDCKVAGTSGFVLSSKVKASKLSIKRWLSVHNKSVSSIKGVEEKLEEVERKTAIEGWMEGLRCERICQLSDYWKSLLKEEQMWRQKARVKWLKEGDTNSKFFYSMANGRRRNNYIGDIFIDGVRCSNPQRIRERVVRFFKNHYKNVEWQRPKMRGLAFKQLDQTERMMLEDEFSGEEVWLAVCSCDGNKAPGPDGLNLGFVRHNWAAIQEDFMKFIHEFHKDSSIVKELNKTFIALIPK